MAVTSNPLHSPEGLLQEADLALYHAKDRGRDRVEVFDEDLRTRAVGRLETERMLRRAVEEGRLRLEFQPIIDLRSGRTLAAEALVRVWDPVHRALIPAASFIEVAEETGLLAAVDDFVLAAALDQAATWTALLDDGSSPRIAVNLTARHLADPRCADAVLAGLAERGLPARALQVEVTERVFMEVSNSAMRALAGLRDAGVRVGLDEFGTGYSSLSYLRIFPLDFVKIDRSFVHELPSSTAARAIVASIVQLCHALDMTVVAEAIETRAQLEILEALRCNAGQGFLFDAPGPAVAVEGRVRAGLA